MKALGLFDKATQDVQDTLKFGLGNVYYAAAEYDKAIKIFKKLPIRSFKAKLILC